MATKPVRSRAANSPSKKYMNHVMFDQETLDTLPTAVMLSIGAVKFDLESGKLDPDGFYASLSVNDQLACGRTISESTLTWWMEQSPEARAVFREPKQTLESALVALSDWLGHNKRCVWSNGAAFDIPMLEHAYASYGLPTPWEFWNARCVRTYRALPGAKNVPKVEPLVAHNALHDAVAQAKHVQAIQAMLKEAMV